MKVPADLEKVLRQQRGWFITGSSILPNGGKDLDIVVLLDSYSTNLPDFNSIGFHRRRPQEDKQYIIKGNLLLERNNIDLIVTEEEEVYFLWHKAMTIVKALELDERADRMLVHHVLLERQDCYDRPAIKTPQLTPAGKRGPDLWEYLG